MKHLVLAGALILSGCTTVGEAYDANAISTLVPGETNMAEAIALVGEPSSKSDVGQGNTLLQWMSIKSTYLNAKRNHDAILFDKNGVMLRQTHSYQDK